MITLGSTGQKAGREP